MHADNGEIIVTDVNLVPDLSEGSVMLQQASDSLWGTEQRSCRGMLSMDNTNPCSTDPCSGLACICIASAKRFTG